MRTLAGVRLLFWVVRLGGKLALTLLLLGAIVLILYTSFWLPDPALLVKENPTTTAFMERGKEKALQRGERLEIRHHPVPLADLSPELIKAVRIAEDDRFFQHNGFDFTEIKNAAEENYRAGKVVRGGSTLSQQLAKNLYLAPDKTFRRKFDEMLLTWKLEQSLTKDRILELYLNHVDWGHGCFGAEAASRFYFSKPAIKLNAREAAYLAALLPNPDYLGSHSGEAKRKSREGLILARMKREGKSPTRESAGTVQVVDRTPSPLGNPSPSTPTDEPSATWTERLSGWGAGARSRVTDWLFDRPMTVKQPPRATVVSDPAPRPQAVPVTQRVLEQLGKTFETLPFPIRDPDPSAPLPAAPQSVPLTGTAPHPVPPREPAPSEDPPSLVSARRKAPSTDIEGPTATASENPVAQTLVPSHQTPIQVAQPASTTSPSPATPEAQTKPPRRRLLEKLAHLENTWGGSKHSVD